MANNNYSFWGCAVLGMHDAIVSTTGLVVGLVFAAAGRYAILLTAIIASVAAGLSMTASEYLAVRAGGNARTAMRCGIATGAAYLFTAGMLVVPFLFITNTFVALAMTYITAVSVIFFFNFVKSHICHERFWPRFVEMISICAIVTFAAFIIGECAKLFFGVEI
ncbi:MAG: VIT1/CCC1 transporter family protein [Alphaproteobacteria bacterium]|nr:VIT1/CCC1 transporter family protein [Alphaproteobacteria bacterium]